VNLTTQKEMIYRKSGLNVRDDELKGKQSRTSEMKAKVLSEIPPHSELIKFYTSIALREVAKALEKKLCSP